MNNELVAWINVEKRRLEWDKPTLWETPTVVKLDRIPLYTHPVNPKYDPETGEPLIDGYPLFSGLSHPVKELTPCEELRAFQEQQNGVFSEHNACCYRHECRIVWDDWDKLRSNPVKELTYEDGIEECAKRAEAYAYMSPNFTALAEELRAILRKAQYK